MAICDSCKRLAAASRRPDVPSHLLRIEAGSAIDQHYAHYRCVACLSQWRWIAPATWVLMLPPESAPPTPRQIRSAWWATLGKMLAGSRPNRRGPIEMRAPRLAVRRPSLGMSPTQMPPPSEPDTSRTKNDTH